jgi:hypothetical protein
MTSNISCDKIDIIAFIIWVVDQMRLFDVLPKEIFSILASPNQIIYSNALAVLYDAFRENLKIPKIIFI